MKFSTNTSLTTKNILVISDLKLIFEIQNSSHNKAELEVFLTDIHLKRFSILWIKYFIGRIYELLHRSETCIKSATSIRYLTWEFYIKRPKQMVELKKIMILDEHPHLISVLDINAIYPLIAKTPKKFNKNNFLF